MEALETIGYHTTRAAGSLGMFDVIAIDRQGIKLIQVKTNRNASPVEREQIALFDRLPTNATKEIWIYKDYERKPEIIIIGEKA
jgi:hypothetical protein